MDEKLEVLLQVLEKLNLNQASFQASVASGEMTKGLVHFGACIVALPIAMTLLSKLNKAIDLNTGLHKLVQVIRGKGDEGEAGQEQVEKKGKKKAKADTKHVDVTKDDEYYMEWCRKKFEEIRDFVLEYGAVHMLVSLFIFFQEIKLMMRIIAEMLTSVILVFNCLNAPEKVLLDYILDKF